MWYVQLETRNFTFSAYGATREAAARALADGWNKHAAEYKIAFRNPTALVNRIQQMEKGGDLVLPGDTESVGDVQWQEFRDGLAYRDGECLTSRTPTPAQSSDLTNPQPVLSQEHIRQLIPTEDGPSYDQGFRDACESLALILAQEAVSEDQQQRIMESLFDAFANNAPDEGSDVKP